MPELRYNLGPSKFILADILNNIQAHKSANIKSANITVRIKRWSENFFQKNS